MRVLILILNPPRGSLGAWVPGHCPCSRWSSLSKLSPISRDHQTECPLMGAALLASISGPLYSTVPLSPLPLGCFANCFLCLFAELCLRPPPACRDSGRSPLFLPCCRFHEIFCRGADLPLSKVARLRSQGVGITISIVAPTEILGLSFDSRPTNST